jgi:hypothetical protein
MRDNKNIANELINITINYLSHDFLYTEYYLSTLQVLLERNNDS